MSLLPFFSNFSHTGFLSVYDTLLQVLFTPSGKLFPGSFSSFRSQVKCHSLREIFSDTQTRVDTHSSLFSQARLFLLLIVTTNCNSLKKQNCFSPLSDYNLCEYKNPMYLIHHSIKHLAQCLAYSRCLINIC